jgi:uncharacterized protein (DUF362 family)
MTTTTSHSSHEPGLDRRALLVVGGAAALGLIGYSYVEARKPKAAVFIAKGQSYAGDLERTIADGLVASGLVPEEWRGKRILLKPNMVEPTRACPHMTTHPAVIVATAEVFRRWGATVKVGEAPGHVRDTELALVESGVQEALDAAGLEFADLNYEDAGWVANAGRASPLAGIYFPRSVLEADLVVSLPKLKTHHWVGLTASMKNLYGLLPGIKYGWPKNVLHHAGIPETVIDINASAPRTATVVDAIDCMEGDGPIMGSLKPMGLIVVGTNLPAVDATCARLMSLRPQRVSYLQLAADRLGPIAERRIEQRGERWQPLASPFTILDVPHLHGLQAGTGELVS